jgi:hypothetical protein
MTPNQNTVQESASNENPPEEKHVIFLGAGASASSGYPMGNGLSILLSSWSKLRQEIEKHSPTAIAGDFAKCLEEIWGENPARRNRMVTGLREKDPPRQGVTVSSPAAGKMV